MAVFNGTSSNDSFVAPTGANTVNGFSGIDTISFDFRLFDATFSWVGNEVIIDTPMTHLAVTGIEVFQFTDTTVNESDGNPLVHCDTVGRTQNRDPSGAFDTSKYLSANPDVAAAHGDPLAHFLQFGGGDGHSRAGSSGPRGDVGSTRRRILDAAYLLFRARGYARVSVDEIAAAAAVTKRTLYRHFACKDVVVEEILKAQHQLALTSSRTLNHFPETADELVDMLFSDIAAWSATTRWSGSGFTRAVMEFADLPGHPARAIARQHKALLEAHVADQFTRLKIASAVERARQVWLLAEGAMVSMLIHRDSRYIDIAALTAKELLKRGRNRTEEENRASSAARPKARMLAAST